MNYYLTAAFAAAAIPMAAASVQASTFDLSFNLSGFNDSQRSVFGRIETFWESMISGYIVDPGFNTFQIDASAVHIDGSFGTLASAGPTGAVHAGEYVYSTGGGLILDQIDLYYIERNDQLEDLVNHEVAHVLGLGTLWEENGLYEAESGRYTGAAALEAYRGECDANATFIPVDIVSGEGTRNAHWDEEFGCGNRELMTGFLSSNAFFSDTSLASFTDLGYRLAGFEEVIAPSPVPLPASGVMLVAGLGAFGAIRRRRNKAA
ncbi:VPLPA-CTERM sorting domain-containing protein [Profundibacterium mesophilum]|uniref:Leishmanolysin n=1 Tax=Profundibacterium mesophilum KAUST100406-0324 TaxID=1037889 RepID=A0A921TDP9_9RHOB|nr:VPLPA-CTERM sorting domain-containing protein [Profundibacterium mesophilum]KAF0676561.1 leishmanolysin [Profundibacterium mesophilum KAUST100406-0324]